MVSEFERSHAPAWERAIRSASALLMGGGASRQDSQAPAWELSIEAGRPLLAQAV